MRVCEIEINGPRNDNVMFLPLQRVIRGRFEFARIAEPMNGQKRDEWGDAIPGQVLGIDLDDKKGYVRELLHDDSHQDAMAKVQAHKFRLGPRQEDIRSAHLPTWLYWMKRLVEAGLARVVKGALPDKIDGTPQTQFFFRNRPERTDGKRIEELETMLSLQSEQIKQQSEQIDRLLAAMTPQAQQK